MSAYELKPPKEVQRKSETNPNIAARVGADLAQRLRAFCARERCTMESAMQVAIAEFLEKRGDCWCAGKPAVPHTHGGPAQEAAPTPEPPR